MEGYAPGVIAGRHWTGIKGIREYSNILKSRKKASLLWHGYGNRVARAFGARVGVGIAAATLLAGGSKYLWNKYRHRGA